MDEMGCFEFCPFYADVDDMRVYVVGADGHVSSCLVISLKKIVRE
jgi:hypothetical protein